MYSTIRDIIIQAEQNFGAEDAIRYKVKKDEIETKTYGQLKQDSDSFGCVLEALGEQGGHIAITGMTSYPWIVSYLGAVNSGSVAVPLDVALPAEELCELVDRADATVFVVDEVRSDVAAIVKQRCPKLKYLISMQKEESDENVLSFWQLLKEHEGSKEFKVEPDQLCTIMFTSGTTGKSKGVMLTHRNVASNCTASMRVLTGRHAIAFLPLHHTLSWVSGLYATYIVSEWGYLCDGINHIQQDIKKFQPYNFTGVPLVVETVYDRIWKTARKMGKEELLKKGIKISNVLMKFGIDKRRKIFKMVHDNLGGNLDMIICGGAYLDPKYEKGLYDIGIDVFNGYGLTECSPVITCNHPKKFKFGSVGTPLECNEIKIVDADEDGVGEIYVRGSNVMVGYYNDPEATAAAFDGDWFKTGDFGRIDEDGFLFMVGRKKNLIILSNGKNVSPEEIEEKLMNNIPYVKEVLVYQEGDKITGEFFLNEEDYPDCKDKLDADVKNVNASMPAFKRVTKIVVRDEEFPKTTTMKIARKYHTN